MAIVYHPFKVALSDDQKGNLAKAVKDRAAVTLRVKPEQIGNGDDLPLTTTQINRLKKAAGAGRGADITFSKTQIGKTKKMIGGNLFTTALSLARPFLPAAVKTVGMAGLSFGAEKLLKKIFGSNIGPREVQLYRLVQMMSLSRNVPFKIILSGKAWFAAAVRHNMGAFLACWLPSAFLWQ